ncbi:MAG: 50S ribosomal protein L6 [Puniceicoccales bacterium]|jgi:large subunit ribosomal protein L6|nr:50S ribosomal protein L6 [Puniceicoccales bacterium]
MSRIGKSPICIPANVKVSIDGSRVAVEGPLGKNEKTFDDSVTIKHVGSEICVLCKDENDKHSCMMHGTVRSIVNSMVTGVVSGYSKNLEISGVGFKATAKGQNILDLSLGYSHEILYAIPNGIKLEIDQSGTKVAVKGVDKKLVGQVAADIKRFYPVEPYKGKGVRIVGEFVRRKEGKKTA